ncbi:MAG: ATPase [Alphaproteobacteria bacterium]|nr:ATPase [Alphaproteobacteria bacterium]
MGTPDRNARRFYGDVGVEVVDAGFLVVLDRRPVRTPMRALLCLPNASLADAVASEWRAQGEVVRPSSMPLTQLANTAIDRLTDAPVRASMISEIMRFATADLLCYRADHPPELAERQAAAWQPVLDWLEARFGAPLTVTPGLLAVSQPEPSLLALRRVLEACGGFPLAGVQSAATVCGSLALALALREGRLSAEEVFAASHVDEHFQAEQWGEDAEAGRRRDHLRDDVRAAALFLSLAEPNRPRPPGEEPAADHRQ